MRATVILGPTLPTQTLSPAGNGGGGGQGSGEGSAKGAGALQNRHLSLGASVPHNCPCPEPGPTWDVFRSPCWHRPGSLACPGEPASYFSPLARPVLLCPGSGLSRAAREPSGGGPPRFILRLALRAASWPEPPQERPGDLKGEQEGGLTRGLGNTPGTLASSPGPAREALCPVKTGQSSSGLSTAGTCTRPLIRPLLHQQVPARPLPQALKRCQSLPCCKSLRCQEKTGQPHPLRKQRRQLHRGVAPEAGPAVGAGV